MEIWIVERRYEGFEVAFSSKEKAIEYIEKQRGDSFNLFGADMDTPITHETPVIRLDGAA